MILALDPAIKTGWAVLMPNGKRIASGVWDLKSTLKPVRAPWLAVKMMDVLISNPAISSVVYETSVQRGHAQKFFLGLVGAIEGVCAITGKEIHTINNSTLKRLATGSGKADKKAMIAEAAERFNLDHLTLDDNEADALLCGSVHLENL